MKIKYPFNITDLRIELYRQPGYDSGLFYSISIAGNGEVVYADVFENPTIKKTNIPKGNVFMLFKYAVAIGFFEMEELIAAEAQLIFKDGVVDQSLIVYDLMFSETSKLEIKIRNKTKTVYITGTSPKNLLLFANRIVKAAGAKEWIERGNA